MKSITNTRGVITIIRHTKDGDLIEKIENIETRAGAEHRAKVFAGEEQTGITHIGVGSGVNAATFEDAALTTPIANGKVTVTTQRNGHILTYTAVFPAGVGTGAISELGLYSGNVLCNRATRPVLNKLESEVFTVVWSTEAIPVGVTTSL